MSVVYKPPSLCILLQQTEQDASAAVFIAAVNPVFANKIVVALKWYIFDGKQLSGNI